MKNLPALFLTAAFGLSIAGPLLAQAPDGPPPGGDPQAQGGGFQGQGGGFQGQGGGFGGQRQGGRGGYGRQRRAPFAFGTVSAVDATAGTVTVTTGGGQSQTINVNPDAKIISQQTASVSDLKVGDQIVVQGVPTGITASSVTVGQPPTGLPGAGGGFGGRRGGPGGDAAGGFGAGSGADSQAFATATGTIKALPTKAEPHLALTMSSDAVLFLKIADTAKVVKYVPLTLAGIKTGDTIIATGQTGTDGTLAANSLGVNMTLPNGGQFGGGQFGGGGGQYGRGGYRRAPADDQGGQGNAGGPGGDPGAPPPPQDGGAPPPPAPDAAGQPPMDNGQ